MREIHHRVKNNLQIVSSLLRLQARRCDDTSSAQSLLESRLRVETLGLSLVRQLAGQLGGMYEIFNCGGAAVHITFPFQQAAGGQS